MKYSAREHIYLEYLEELEEIRGERFPVTEHDKKRYIHELMREGGFEWIDLSLGGSLVGFLIVSAKKDGSHEIEEAYVRPQYRNHGFMSNEVRKYLLKHRGTFNLKIYDRNRYAVRFWDDVFQDNGYRLLRMEKYDDRSTEYVYREI